MHIRDALCNYQSGYILWTIGPMQRDTGPIEKLSRSYRLARTRLDVKMELTIGQKAPATLEPKDKSGNPARVDGVPEWVTDNSDILTLEPSDDGLSCMIRLTGALGTANVQVTVDADTGDGIAPLIGTGEVTVVAGEATTVDLKFGPAEPDV